MGLKRIVNNKFVATANNSVSTVISNASFIIKDLMWQFFPEGAIKDFHLGTSMASIRQHKADIFKKNRPFMIMKPKISLENDQYFDGLYRYHNAYIGLNADMTLHEPLFSDMQKDIYIYFINDRINLSFDIEIVCDTDMEQKNIAYSLKSKAPHKVPFFLFNQPLEVEVPKYLIKYLAMVNGFIDPKGEKPFDEDKFQLYLDSHSLMPITKKIKTSTGRPEYFFTYKSNIICVFENFPSLDDGERINMISSNFRINDELMTGFWCPMHFYLDIRNPEIHLKDTPYEIKKLKDKHGEFALTGHPNLTFIQEEVPFLAPKELLNGKTYIYDISFECEGHDEHGMEEVPIKDLFSPVMQRLINYMNKYSLNPDELFEIQVYRKDEKLEKNSNAYTIDWKNMVIKTYKFDIGFIYSIFFYVDMAKANKILRTLAKKEEESDFQDLDIKSMNRKLFINIK